MPPQTPGDDHDAAAAANLAALERVREALVTSNARLLAEVLSLEATLQSVSSQRDLLARAVMRIRENSEDYGMMMNRMLDALAEALIQAER